METNNPGYPVAHTSMVAQPTSEDKPIRVSAPLQHLRQGALKISKRYLNSNGCPSI